MFSYWSTPEVLPDGNFKNLNVENASIRNLSLEMSNASTATVDVSNTVITKVNPTNGAFTFTVLPIVGTTVTGLSCNFVVL
jgi:hypothetical protein